MDPQQFKLLADAEFDRALLRKNLRENATAQLTVPFAGGLFVANTALISYLGTETGEMVYLEDIYGIPVYANRQQMLNAVREQYQTAMKAWYEEYQSSNRIRRAQNV